MNEQGRKGSESGGSASSGGAVQRRAAGKTTRTSGLASMQRPAESVSDVPMGALQFSMTPSAPAAPSAPADDPFGLHLEGSAAQTTAARGVESGGGALPHLDTIQRSFGKHDVSGISAHTGGQAAEAAGALGAEAYATGNSVAFGASPSLHTAAHEAAHVVQQRAGVSLKGGVGESGDVYEQHADRVADAVVAGQSAEALLDNGPGGGGASAGPAIQKKDGEAPKPGAVAYDPSTDPDVQAAEGDTEGDELRKAVLAAARKRLAEKTTIVSEEAIEDQRKGNVKIKLFPKTNPDIVIKLPLGEPMRNFTTCIEFAGQTFRDGAAATGDDAKEDAQLGRGLPTFMLLFNKEVELNLMLESFQKTINQWQAPEGEVPTDPKKMKALDKAKHDRAQHEAKKAELEKTLPTEEEAKGLDATGKAKLTNTKARIKAEEDVIKKIDSNIAFIQKEIDKFEAKIVKATEDKGTIEGLNDAYQRAPEQIPAGKRPQLGEYILTGAAATQDYSVKGAKAATLHKGMFKHIAVFNGMGDDKGLPADGKWEKWKTIDGGGIEPTGTQIFVQVEPPYSVQHIAPDPSQPWASKNALLGWVDADKLAALSKNDDAAAAAGLSKKK